MYYYSKSTGGFYTSAVQADAVEITEAEHVALLEAQSEGKIIQADAQGRPFAAFQTYTVEEVRANKLAALATYRFEKETDGLILGGAIIRTDRESQAMITGAKSYSDTNPNALIDWKGATSWIQIDRATLLAIGQAVGTYVQACFSRERVHFEAIMALSTPEEIKAYNFTTGWPE